MVFREVNMGEVREVLRGWLDGVRLRTVAARAGVDRKTARRYVQAAQEAGLTRDAGPSALDDELIGVVVGAVRPARPMVTATRGRCCLLIRNRSAPGWARTS